MNTNKKHNESRKALVMVSLMAMVIFLLAGCGSFNAGIVDAAPDSRSRPRIVKVTAPAPPPTDAPIHDVRTKSSPGDEEVVTEDELITEDEVITEDVGLEDTAEEAPELLVVESTLEELDAEFSLYTNLTLGYEILVPKQMALFNGDCTYNESQGSYRPKFGIVDTAIFEDGNITYLTFSHYAELQGAQVTTLDDGGQRTNFTECATVSNTLSMVTSTENVFKQMWAIMVANVADEAAVLDIIKGRYGSACQLDEQEPSHQDNVFRVRILGDGKHLEESDCPMNFGVVVNYAPELNKVVIWETGQAYTFVADEHYSVTHDQTMIDSFLFID